MGNDPKKERDKINCLIIGASGGMSDTIMLAQFDPNTGKASLLSIPRDTKVDKPNTAFSKINAIYQGKHADKLVSKVSELTGVEIQYYVVVDTKALREMVDTVGGVYIDVPINMDYDDPTQKLSIHIKKGAQVLDGKNAEGFVRFRHNNNGTGYPRQDLDRAEAQQAFIKALIDELLKPKNVVKIKDYINIAFDNVKTNAKLSDVIEYIPDMVNFKTENLTTATIPGSTPPAQSTGGVSFFIANEKEMEKLVKELFFADENSEEELDEEPEESEKDTENKIKK